MNGISAQVSIYPLRQESLSTVVDAVLERLRAHPLDVQPGPMSTLITGGVDALFTALRDVFHDASGRGDVVMIVTLSNACPVPA